MKEALPSNKCFSNCSVPVFAMASFFKDAHDKLQQYCLAAKQGKVFCRCPHNATVSVLIETDQYKLIRFLKTRSQNSEKWITE